MKKLLWMLRIVLAECFADWFIRPSLDVYKIKWEEAQERDLRNFLTSDTGEKLQAVLLAVIQQTDADAVKTSTERACGYATGQRTLLAVISHLSGHVPPPRDETLNGELQGLPTQRNPYPEPGFDEPDKS